MSRRTERVSELFRRAVAELLFEVLPGPTLTVTAVEVSPDLRQAKVFVRSLATAPDNLLVRLHNEAPRFSTQIFHKYDFKYAPELHFYLDHSAEHVSRVDELLEQVEGESRG